MTKYLFNGGLPVIINNDIKEIQIEVLADNSFEQINKIVEIIKKVKQVKN